MNPLLLLTAMLSTCSSGLPQRATPSPASRAVLGPVFAGRPAHVGAAGGLPASATPPATPAVASAPSGRRKATWVPDYPGPWNASLRVARSKDGLTFGATGGLPAHVGATGGLPASATFAPATEPLTSFANAPTLARLPDGRLLAVFEHYSRTDRRRFGGLASVQSTDEGKSWSDVKPLEIKGLPRRAGPPRGPALAVRPGGRVQLVFVCKDRRGRRVVLAAEWRPKENSDHEDAAVSKDGPRFKLTGRLRPADKGVTIDDLVMLYIDETCHLFGTIAHKQSHEVAAGQRYHGISNKGIARSAGRRFKRLDNLHTADIGTQGGALPIEDGYRFYATSPAGVMSATSADGSDWSRDSGLRLPAGDDPAVVRVKDGSYVMVYVKMPPGARGDGRPHRGRDERVADAGSSQEDETYDRPGEATPTAQQDDWWFYEETESDDADDSFAEMLEEVDTDEPVEGDDDRAEPSEADASEDDIAESPDGELADESATEDALGDYYEQEYTDGGVPLPDFLHRVDYRRWFEERHDPDSVEDNAYDYYAAFMYDADGKILDVSDLPSFQGMFNDADFEGPPAPWNPEDRPQWDESYFATADLVAEFAEATTHESFVRPPVFAGPVSDTTGGGDGDDGPDDPLLNDLLLNLLLPDLSTHRRMVKESLSHAWRAPDGKPDPDAMLDAFDACLGSARHLNQGDTLIEMLVSVSEKNLVEKNARWALKHEVFSPEEMESALELLIEGDHRLEDPAKWVVGEIAFSLDMTQYLFGPVKEGREPALNPERVEQFNKLFSMPEDLLKTPTPEDIASTSAERTASNFLEYYREFAEMVHRGYPEVTASDLEEMTESHFNDSIVSQALLPSLSRVHQLTTRHEASRRATQLTYAIHLHKAQTGQWPASLDDLPPRYTQTARTDPFSGQDFLYRLTDDGFLLYSASENSQDDGGAHHSCWGDKKRDEDEEDDYVFWPPKNR
jgi:hypothetical protein